MKHMKGMKHKKNKKILSAYLFLSPGMIGISIFVLIPFIDSVRRSFIAPLDNKFVGLENYKLVLSNEAFQLAARNTGLFMVICIPLLLVSSLAITLLLNCMKRGKYFLKMSFLFPMAIPVASVVLLWKMFFHQNGLINEFLGHFYIAPIDFMNTKQAFYVLIFTFLWKNIGYDMVLWLSGLSNIPVSYYEAAKIDGAGALARFRYITLPGLVSTIFITAVLSVINSFKVFREAYMIAGNYPHDSIYMLQHLFNNWFMNLSIQKMCAGAGLMALVMIVIILFLNLLNLRRE